MKRRISVSEIGFLILCLLAVILILAQPCEGLGSTGHMAMGCSLITIAGWVFRPWNMPNAVSGMFLLGMMLVVKVPATVVFAGFVQNALWTLIGALFFGLVLIKTGLGRRLAAGILTAFPAKWPVLVIAWILIGIGLSLMTPSMTVRASIMIPIAMECCELYGLPKGSKSASLLILTALMMSLIPGNGWLTGGLTAAMFQGVMETIPELQGMITFDSWLKGALLPVMIITVITAMAGLLLLRPDGELSKEAFLEKMRQDYVPISTKEILSAVILTVCCVLFFVGNRIGLSSTAICLLATVLFFALKILDPEDFSHGINWDLIFFIGSGLCMSSILAETGVSAWLASVISPVLVNLAAHRVVFLFAMLILLFVWRFVDVTTLIPTTVILAPSIGTLLTRCGIHPMVWGCLITIASCTCLLSYTNMWAFMGKKMVGGYCWTEGQIFRYNIGFFAACCVGFAVAIPYWAAVGFI